MTPEPLDSFLIDKAFQPIADRLARWISCYGIAAFLLTGVTLGKAWGAIWVENWWEFVSIAWIAFRCYQAYRLEQSPPSDVLPVERIQGQGWLGRPGLLLAQILVLPALPSLPLIPMWQVSSWWLVIVAAYFMACRRNRPKPKAARVPRGLAYGGASP